MCFKNKHDHAAEKQKITSLPFNILSPPLRSDSFHFLKNDNFIGRPTG